MQDKNKEYWWGKYQRIYRGTGCSMGFPRSEPMNKPIFHGWTALSNGIYCIILCHGWWTHRCFIKIPRWLIRVLKWYRSYKESKRKAP